MEENNEEKEYKEDKHSKGSSMKKIRDSGIFVKIAEELRKETENIGKIEETKKTQEINQEKQKEIKIKSEPKTEPKTETNRENKTKFETHKKIELEQIPTSVRKAIRKRPSGYHLDLEKIFSSIKEHQIERKFRRAQEERKREKINQIKRLEAKRQLEEKIRQEEERKRLIEKARKVRKIKEENFSADLNQLIQKKSGLEESEEKPQITVELDIEKEIDDNSEDEERQEKSKTPLKKLLLQDTNIQEIIDEVRQKNQNRQKTQKTQKEQEDQIQDLTEAREKSTENKEYEVINLPEVTSKSNIPRKRKINNAFEGIELASLKKEIAQRKKNKAKVEEARGQEPEFVKDKFASNQYSAEEDSKSFLPDIGSGSKNLDFKIDDFSYFYPKINNDTNNQIKNESPNSNILVKRTPEKIIDNSSRLEAKQIGESVDAERIGQLVDAKLIGRMIEIHAHEEQMEKIPASKEKFKKNIKKSQAPNIKYIEKLDFDNISQNLKEIQRIISKDRQELTLSFNHGKDFQEKAAEKLDFSSEKIKSNLTVIKNDFSFVKDN